MPDMNGKELYSKVEKRLPGVKVIYMSGYTDEVIAHHGVLDPGTHFIQKPFSTRDLAAKVREVLDDVSHGTISPDPP
jgi:DNA-binding response OmpR family regulator